MKIEPTLFDKHVERITVILILFIWCFSLYSFLTLPQQVPIHFDALGRADNHGNKITLFFLPVLGTLIFIALSFLNKFPHLFNYMVKINPENMKQQYTAATKTIRLVKLFVAVLMLPVVIFTHFAASSNGVINGTWLLPFILLSSCIMIFITTRNFKIEQKKVF